MTDESTPAPSATDDDRLLLRHGRVIDVIEGHALGDDVSIMIRGGTIEAILDVDAASTATAEAVGSGLTIDLRGRTVIPGLFNTHTHVALPMPGTLLGLRESTIPKRYGPSQVRTNLTRCLELGITTVRDGLCENLRIMGRLKGALERGELVGPRLIQSVLVGQEGGTFTEVRGPATKLFLPVVGLPVIDYEDPSSGILSFPLNATEGVVRSAVDRAIEERGAECIKIYDQREKKLTYKPGATLMTERQLGAAVDQARKRGVPSTMHHVTVESFRRGVRAGVTSLVHMPIDGALTTEDVREFHDAGCLIEPTTTLAYFYSFELDDDLNHSRLARLRRLRSAAHRRRIEAHWIPELRPLVRTVFDRAVEGRRRAFGLLDLSAVFRYFSSTISHGFDNVRLIAQEAGLSSIACGNDGGPCPSTPAGIDLELEMLDFCLSDGNDWHGLAAADRLRVATINSARAMGLDATHGSISPGKVADLVVVDGDPLTERDVIGKPVAAVLKEGKLVVNRCGLALKPIIH